MAVALVAYWHWPGVEASVKFIDCFVQRGKRRLAFVCLELIRKLVVGSPAFSSKAGCAQKFSDRSLACSLWSMIIWPVSPLAISLF